MHLSARFYACVATIISALSSLPARAQDVLSGLEAANIASDPTVESVRPGHWHGFLGGGLVAVERPLADNITSPLPLVSVAYRDTLYWHIGQAGVWLLTSDDHAARVGLVLQGRAGYDPKDFDGLAGMGTRHASVEAGAKATWRTPGMTVSLDYVTDISGNSRGDSAVLGLSYPMRLSAAWELIPGLGAEWLSTEVVDYYFGVRPTEAAPMRPAYAGRSTVNLRGTVMAYRKVTRTWSLFGGAGFTRLGNGISDSPITLHDRVATIFVGGGRRF